MFSSNNICVTSLVFKITLLVCKETSIILLQTNRKMQFMIIKPVYQKGESLYHASFSDDLKKNQSAKGTEMTDSMKT